MASTSTKSSFTHILGRAWIGPRVGGPEGHRCDRTLFSRQIHPIRPQRLIRPLSHFLKRRLAQHSILRPACKLDAGDQHRLGPMDRAARLARDRRREGEVSVSSSFSRGPSHRSRRCGKPVPTRPMGTSFLPCRTPSKRPLKPLGLTIHPPTMACCVALHFALVQMPVRPETYGSDSRLETMPSRPSSQARAITFAPAKSR